MLRIRLVRSPIGNTSRNRATVKALGLRKMHQVVEKEDHPSIRGMVHSVKHLLEVEIVEGSPAGSPSRPQKKLSAAAPQPVRTSPTSPKGEVSAADAAEVTSAKPKVKATKGAAEASAVTNEATEEKKPKTRKKAEPATAEAQE